MTGSLVTGLLVVHGTASLLLALFGLHRLLLALAYRRVTPRVATPAPLGYPVVTVQIPLYNERYVAARCIRAVAAIDYPRDAIEIQVLDDSTDDTPARVQTVVEDLRRRGHRVTHLRRGERTGFKAGALAHGLETAGGEFIAIFDADFVPPRDFLMRIIGEFDDPATGMVQARWGHTNRNMSWLTRAQAVQLDAHFMIEHGVRADVGLFFNFNGTAGVWRRSAIRAAGGWQSDTLTEDLDLSYRAQMAGWRFVYRHDIVVPAEVPAEVAAYRIQQQRWAQGGIQTARKHLRGLLSGPFPFAIKRAAVAHLLIHLSYPLLVLVTLAGLTATFVHGAVLMRRIMLFDGALLMFAMASLSVFYGTVLWAGHPSRRWRELHLVPVIMLLGAGIAFGQSVAVLRGCLGSRTPFRRTPKYRLMSQPNAEWRGARYRLPALTGAAGSLLGGSALLALAITLVAQHRMPPSGLVVLLSSGLLLVGATAWAQRRRTA